MKLTELKTQRKCIEISTTGGSRHHGHQDPGSSPTSMKPLARAASRIPRSNRVGMENSQQAHAVSNKQLMVVLAGFEPATPRV